jgi:(p)ppGpp synthase/HD superfamily hydrolase
MKHEARWGFHPKFEKALSFVCRPHAAQTWKETNIPYISHLIGVAGIVPEHGGDADGAIAQVFYKATDRQGPADHAHMQRHLQPAVDRFKAIAEEEKRVAKKKSDQGR